MARDYRKVVAFQKADEFAVSVYALTRDYFPQDERYGLVAQIRRAAVSVAANIAEGATRRHRREFVQFLSHAKGSLAEVEYYLHLAHRLKYLPDEQYQLIQDQRQEVARVLQGLLLAVDKQIRQQRPSP